MEIEQEQQPDVEAPNREQTVSEPNRVIGVT